jgi:hypothetical protein
MIQAVWLVSNDVCGLTNLFFVCPPPPRQNGVYIYASIAPLNIVATTKPQNPT